MRRLLCWLGLHAWRVQRRPLRDGEWHWARRCAACSSTQVACTIPHIGVVWLGSPAE